MKYILLVVFLILSATYPTQRVTGGFLKGDTYLDLSPNEKRAYAMGFVNGVLTAPALGAPEADVARFADCVKPMNDEQIAAIITKYVNDNPARWHLPLNLLSHEALVKACPEKRR